MIRVGIVDDHPVFRLGLRRCLERESDIQVVWESGRASEVAERVLTDSVDVVLMDLNLGPDEDALGATRALTQRHPRIKVIVVSAALEWEAAEAARTAGATGYVGKDTAISDMVATIQQLVSNDIPSGKPPAGVRPRGGDFKKWAEKHELSRRELEVLAELRRGNSNREIANRLRVSTTTVNKHVHQVLSKLRVKTRGQAVALLNAAEARGWSMHRGAVEK